jgi:hypothetical protein
VLLAQSSAGRIEGSNGGGGELILATVKVEDFDRFWNMEHVLDHWR